MQRALIVLPLLFLGACPQGGAQTGPPAARGTAAPVALELYDVELREKVNTCRELDPQVARETLFIERFGEQGVMHLGAERTFPVKLAAGKVTGEFLETDHSTVDGRHVVCKRITGIDLSVAEGRISGSYERKRRQECLLDAKPCFTTWSVSGELQQDK